MISRAEKAEQIANLTEKFSRAKAAFLMDFKGMSVEEVTRFRKNLRPVESEFRVVRNTLALRALSEFPKMKELLEKDLVGNNGVVFAYGDVSASAKAIADFSKDVEKLQFKRGAMEGTSLDEQGLKYLAALPPRPVLQAQFLGLLSQPPAKFLGILSAVPRDFVSLLDALKKKKEETNEEKKD